MKGEPVDRRETLALPVRDVRFVDRLMDADSLERWALSTLIEVEPDASKATVLLAAFHVGTDRISELALDEGYRRLAEQATEEEVVEERAITASRRSRERAPEHG